MTQKKNNFCLLPLAGQWGLFFGGEMLASQTTCAHDSTQGGSVQGAGKQVLKGDAWTCFLADQKNVRQIFLPISPLRVDNSKGPHRVSRAHWPTKENTQNFLHFLDFCGSMEKMTSDGPKWTLKVFFLLIQTLPTFWAERM